MADQLEPQEGSCLGRRYEVVRVVARGGMGAVYEAHDTRLNGRRCAVKALLDTGRAERDRAEAAAWFAREAQILSTLSHPSIPAVSDYFSEQGRHYLVMDFIDGRTLEDIVLREGTPGLLVAEVVRWGIDLCAVLHYLHTRRPPVIFRDLKPANVMLARDGTLKLIDFGIARCLETANTGQAVVTMIGTPGYAPPEQYQGLADPRSDVYSLGATLHHLLSGRDPRDHQPFSFPPLRELCPQISPALAAAVARAVALPAAERFAGADALANELDDALAGRVAAPPPAPRGAIAPPVVRVSARGEADFASIGAALRAAPLDARIEVQPGHYAESLLIERPVELIAAGPADQVIIEAINAPCIVMRAETALVRGFTLRAKRRGVGSSGADPSGAGAPDTESSGTRSFTAGLPGAGLSDTDTLSEVALDGAPGGRVRRAIAVVTGALPALIGALGGAVEEVRAGRPCHAVDVGGGQMVLRDCRIGSDSPWCIIAVHGLMARLLLHRCELRGGHDVGVLFYGQSQGTIEECTIVENGSSGVAVTEGSTASVIACTIERGRGTGITFEDCCGGVVERCTIRYNARAGISLARSADPAIRHCRINDNGGSAIRAPLGAHSAVEGCDLSGNHGGAWDTGRL